MSATICLALAIYFEAGRENEVGRAAVGWSVINSATTLHRKPWRVCGEVFGGRYVGVNNGYKGKLPHGKLWQQSVVTAKEIMGGVIQDPTGGATNFECTRWKSCVKIPWWSVGMEYKGVFGTQKFWRYGHG